MIEVKLNFRTTILKMSKVDYNEVYKAPLIQNFIKNMTVSLGEDKDRHCYINVGVRPK
jgi:hypothetical protein